jgi:hypothetical protein
MRILSDLTKITDVNDNMLNGIDTVQNSLQDSLLPNSKPKSYFS